MKRDMRTGSWVRFWLLAGCLAVLTGCFGSSSSSDSDGNGDETEVTAFEGSVLAPGGEVAQMEQPAMERMLALVMGEARASMSGLSPVAGIDIELIEVDNDGNQVGEVLATGVTSSTGDYTLTLPESAVRAPAANLVIRAVGLTEDLRAQAVEDTVTVDPVSEFVLRKLIDFQVPLDVADTAAVVNLRGDIDQLGIDAGSEGLDSAFAALEESAGAFMDSKAETLAAGDAADFSGVLGRWSLAGMRPELGYRTDDTGNATGTLGVFMEHNGFDLQGLDGELAVVPDTVDGIGFFTEQYGSVNLYGPEIELNPRDEDAEPLPGIIQLSDDLTFRIEGGFSELVDPEDDFALRRISGTERFRFAGPDLRVGLNRATETLYGVTEDDGLDEDDFRGERLLSEFTVIGRTGDDLAEADLADSYGAVSFGIEMESDLLELFAETFTLDFDGNGTATLADTAPALQIEHPYGAFPQLEETPAAQESRPYQLNGNALVLDDDVDVSVTAGRETLFGNTFQFDNNAARSAQSFFMGVRLPDSQPDMDDRRYRIQGVSLRASGEGALDKELRQFAELVFSGGNVTLENERERIVGRNSPQDKPVVTSSDETGTTGAIPFQLGTNGSLTIETDSTTLSGFVSADGNVIVLRDFVDEGTGEDFTLGLWIGVLTE